MKGTARDPDLDYLVVRLRYEVLLVLRGVGRDDRGLGLSLSTLELEELVRPHVEVELDARRVGQVARWFALDRAGDENVLFWVNENPARFGVRRESPDVDVDRVLAAYAGRLAAFELARNESDEVLRERVLRVGRSANAALEEGARREGLLGPDSETEEDSPESAIGEDDPDFSARPTGAADVDYVSRQENQGLTEQNSPDDRPVGEVAAQFEARSIEAEIADFAGVPGRDPRDYEHARVLRTTELVLGFVSPALRWEAVAAAVRVATGRSTSPDGPFPEVRAAVSLLNPWERTNVLLRLAEEVAPIVREAAAVCRRTARRLDREARGESPTEKKV